jgi:hypothetical protein
MNATAAAPLPAAALRRRPPSRRCRWKVGDRSPGPTEWRTRTVGARSSLCYRRRRLPREGRASFVSRPLTRTLPDLPDAGALPEVELPDIDVPELPDDLPGTGGGAASHDVDVDIPPVRVPEVEVPEVPVSVPQVDVPSEPVPESGPSLPPVTVPAPSVEVPQVG